VDDKEGDDREDDDKEYCVGRHMLNYCTVAFLFLYLGFKTN